MPALKLRTFLVYNLRLSNKEALTLLRSKKVLVDGQVAKPGDKVLRHEEIRVDGRIIREKTRLVYIKFYKPRGIESTLNRNIPGNLTTVFNYPEKLFPVGRLDQESEGLMIFTNDGHYYKRIAEKEANVEKEYRVTVNKPITPGFVQQMESGVMIMGKMTKRATVIVTPLANDGDTVFHLILKEGLNRQIRRMCYKLGYEVDRLVRVRIDNVELGRLAPGKWEEISV
jgi:23S rRNA pseudouridine2604 synthase